MGAMKATKLFGFLAMALMLTMVTGCGVAIEGRDVVPQVEKILAQSHLACDMSVTFQGVGEGDADTAYAMIHLKTAGSSG